VSSKSFPYLAIARQYGADYGDVLSYADLVGNGHDTWPRPPTFWQKLAAKRLAYTVKRAIEDRARVGARA
jgi:hypothetical protein